MSRPLRRSPLMLAAALVVVTMAGCIDGANDDPPADPVPMMDLDAFVNPIHEHAAHQDAPLHTLSWNMERTGGALLHEGTRGYGAPHALDVKNDRLFVSAYAATGDRVAGVYIYDVSDPADPQFLGDWLVPGGAAGDRNMDATADGEFVVVSYEEQDCGGSIHPFQPGLWLIDASDPSNPEETDFVGIGDLRGTTTTSGQHSLTVISTDDGDWVVGAGGTGKIYEIDRATKTLVEVGALGIGHDSSVFWDPIENRTLLLSADVSELKVYDVSDPANPNLLGGWRPENLGSYYIHTAVADHIDGRNIAIVNSEDFLTDPSTFWVLDITEIEVDNVVELAQWFTPDDIPSGDLTFSLHNPRIQGGILTYSYYHAGIWQFDLNDPARWEDPKPRAYYLPTEPVGRAAIPDGTPFSSRLCGTLLNSPDGSLDIPMDAVPFTFDVEMHQGYVYAADINTGIHALRFMPETAADQNG